MSRPWYTIARFAQPQLHKRAAALVVADLDRVCKSDTTAPAACEHGIGHGILEYVGHQKLIEALEACKQTRQLDPVAGCTSGVFMEYNIPLVVHENGSLSIDARPLADVRTPFDVCPTMPTTFRTSCYHELPQWWQQVFTKDIRVMGATCVQNANSKEAQACLQGIANIIPSQAGYSPDVAQTMCDSMPTTRSREECLVNAAWGFVKNFNMPEAASKLCEGLSDDMQHRCPT